MAKGKDRAVEGDDVIVCLLHNGQCLLYLIEVFNYLNYEMVSLCSLYILPGFDLFFFLSGEEKKYKC